MPTKTCLRQSHRLTATRFPDGQWVASCSCAQYMTPGYATPDLALDVATDAHYTAIMPPAGQVGGESA